MNTIKSKIAFGKLNEETLKFISHNYSKEYKKHFKDYDVFLNEALRCALKNDVFDDEHEETKNKMIELIECFYLVPMITYKEFGDMVTIYFTNTNNENYYIAREEDKYTIKCRMIEFDGAIDYNSRIIENGLKVYYMNYEYIQNMLDVIENEYNENQDFDIEIEDEYFTIKARKNEK